MTNGSIDLVHLEKYIVGDDALRNEILNIFEDQAALLSGQFDDGQTDEAWGNTAHALKGASRGIGAWALGDLCAHAESLTGDGSDKFFKREAVLIDIRKELVSISKEATRVRNFGKSA